ncbi:hypothetical protein CCGE531_28940 (plasmid) [Rhizobium sp. CCGE531]|nr:hypothetical protein CCGE531_28940 [Rhizobium sp. CCGE531]AYG76454.1 hypothetical protein CCGE532_28415 [Rhizobium sp. CCGE532]
MDPSNWNTLLPENVTKIAVVGATGMTGSRTTRLLECDGFDVAKGSAILARSPNWR